MLLALKVLLNAVLAAGAASPAEGEESASFVVAAAGDLVMSGGAQVIANPLSSIRSGNPGQRSVAAIKVPLSKGIVLTSLSFEYRYITGFGAAGTGSGSNFTIQAAGLDLYTSPHLTDYAYSDNRSNYSKPVPVRAAGLSIKVPSTGDSRLEIRFDNNDRNVQLLLPIQVNVTCSGGPCVFTPPCFTPPWPRPSPCPSSAPRAARRSTTRGPACAR